MGTLKSPLDRLFRPREGRRYKRMSGSQIEEIGGSYRGSNIRNSVDIPELFAIVTKRLKLRKKIIKGGAPYVRNNKEN